MKTTKTGVKKYNKFYRSFEGEYSGICFEIVRRKMEKKEYKALVKAGKRPKSRIEYIYRDGDIGTRRLEKKHYINLVNNSEVLYDNKKCKHIRSAFSKIFAAKSLQAKPLQAKSLQPVPAL